MITYHSDTKLISFGARDYDPTIGRWTTKDPLGLTAGTNLYVYLDGKAIRKSCPIGGSK